MSHAIQKTLFINEPSQILENKKRILVVDDDPHILNYIASTLSNHYEVFGSLRADDALSLAECISPDLILLDMLMPTFNSPHVYSRYKAFSTLKDVPIIAMTPTRGLRCCFAAAEIGAFDILKQPFEPEELREHISFVLDNYPAF